MSTVISPASVERELAGIVGEAYVSRTDFEINGVVPAAVVSPGSAEEVAALLRLANERGLVVAPAGGLTKQQIGGVPERIDIFLSTKRMNRIEQYDPGDLTISVAAGMPFAEMQAQLTEHHQWVPCDAANLEAATVGGLMATAAAGPLKSTFGHMRDFCIGVQFATVDGKVAKGGGMVVKEISGEPVLFVKLEDDFYAYRNPCPGCGESLEQGTLEGAELSCPGCARRYDVRRAGQCLDALQLHLEPIPLLVSEEGIKIAQPSAVG